MKLGCSHALKLTALMVGVLRICLVRLKGLGFGENYKSLCIALGWRRKNNTRGAEW